MQGGVTTCLISGSAVYQCQAIITDEEMKELINKALRSSFKQNSSLPQITTENLKTVLGSALQGLDSATRTRDEQAPKDQEIITLLVNTFLRELSNQLACCLIKWNSRFTETWNTGYDFCCVIGKTTAGAPLPKQEIDYLCKVLKQETESGSNYFPADFFSKWPTARDDQFGASALQRLIK